MHKLIIDLSETVSLAVGEDIAKLFFHGEDDERHEIACSLPWSGDITAMLTSAVAVEYGIVPLDRDEDGVRYDEPTFGGLDNSTLTLWANRALVSTPHVTVSIKL